MNKLIALLCLLPAIAFAGGEKKEICKEDPKTKKQVCKTITVHKKLEGSTKVPPK